MPEWIHPSHVNVPPALRGAVGGHPLVAELLARRGIKAPEEACAFLDSEAYSPASPYELPDLEEGKKHVQEAIRRGEKILVWGDFDVDGQTSTALLVSALRRLGGTVSYHIPSREKESHGVNTQYLRPHLEEGIQLVVTCDTGIDSHDAIEFAKNEGVDVVVTDHHDLPPSLPEANALINPKRLGGGHALRTLPGVGVAYKLVQGLFEDEGQDPAEYLDLIALGIVADIAYLSGDTRYLLQEGLKRLRATDRPGLLAIMNNANVSPPLADEEDIGYRIGPRLNALGRLADANVAVELLTTDDTGRARELAGRLEDLNNRRRLLTNQVYEAANEKLRASPELLQYAALVLCGKSWPAGVIGIVASRLAEEHHKPAILMTSGEEGMARGSARSVQGIDISAAIADQSEMLEAFGGHPMAAGLLLSRGEVARFRQLVSRSIVGQKEGRESKPTLEIARFLPLGELTLDLADELRRLAPFGPGNPPVTLGCKELRAREVQEIGADGAHLKVTVQSQDGDAREVLFWNAGKEDLPEGTFDLALTISTSTFQGERQVQLTWQESRRVAQPAVGIEKKIDRDAEVVDHGGTGDLTEVLRKLDQKDDLQIWVEGLEIPGVDTRTRTELTLCRKLALGTLPPSADVLQEALTSCEPEEIQFVGIDPDLDNFEAFFRRLLGLAKHGVKTEEWYTLRQLAGAMAHEEHTTQKGLAWLENRGDITVEWRGSSRLRIQTGKGVQKEESLQPEIKAALQEASSYRRFLSDARARALTFRKDTRLQEA